MLTQLDLMFVSVLGKSYIGSSIMSSTPVYTFNISGPLAQFSLERRVERKFVYISIFPVFIIQLFIHFSVWITFIFRDHRPSQSQSLKLPLEFQSDQILK